MFNDKIIHMAATFAILISIMIFVIWLLKKFMPEKFTQNKSSSNIKIISHHNLGGKEKLTLVEINNQYLLLGVTSQKITLLHKTSIIPENIQFRNSSTEKQNEL